MTPEVRRSPILPHPAPEVTPFEFDPGLVVKILIPGLDGASKKGPVRIICIEDSELARVYAEENYTRIHTQPEKKVTDGWLARRGLKMISIDEVPQEFRPDIEREVREEKEMRAEAKAHPGED